MMAAMAEIGILFIQVYIQACIYIYICIYNIYIYTYAAPRYPWFQLGEFGALFWGVTLPAVCIFSKSFEVWE